MAVVLLRRVSQAEEHAGHRSGTQRHVGNREAVGIRGRISVACLADDDNPVVSVLLIVLATGVLQVVRPGWKW